MSLKYTFLFTILVSAFTAFSQTTYPKITGYFGIMHPIVSFNREETTVNFRDYYAVGFPTGINIWKSEKIGFSFEIVPNIKDDQGTSKVTNLLFHPGVLIALGNGYTFAGRLAFETSGRYGVTPVFNKTIKKNASSSYYIAVPLPVRFGNDHPGTFTVGFQFGIAF
ncbi:hypothetical protein D0809_20705 [Flavobacterium circumlabens]|uniref:Outer membrane protein beta-barrel domain-containing protein n=1 Tax=Flavobacterium circumlabens TaxID=2133765 RepID=A0A4Y7U7X0_9FLAO|nr:hypothetical protein [Flavobacterium circumlabens]TCN53132.1 hypothetical protein EV142_109115 [Flavobacterium circumlabens]TEB42321.1 hypothetical protein D0809_20705 [Flavobacterium circumlabens]